jgi:hypothetical protein
LKVGKECKLLTTLFNKHKEDGSVPNEWKIAIIWQIYKGKSSVDDI